MSQPADKALVLRDLVLDTQPRVLVGRAPVVPPVSEVQPAALEFEAQPVADLLAAVDPVQPALEDAYAAMRARAYEDGFAEGKSAGFDEGRSEGLKSGQAIAEEAVQLSYQDRLDQLDQLVHSLSLPIRQHVEMAEDALVDTVFAAICHIAGQSFLSRDGVRHVLLHALAQFRSRPLVTIRLHAQDLAALQDDEEIAALLAGYEKKANVQWLADERLVQGGCILESPEGTLDARLSLQLQRVREVLLQARQAQVHAAGPQEPAA